MKNKGISLIVLIITIIVVIILAVTVILTLSKNNPIESAKEAKILSSLHNVNDSIELYKSKLQMSRLMDDINIDTLIEDGVLKEYIIEETLRPIAVIEDYKKLGINGKIGLGYKSIPEETFEGEVSVKKENLNDVCAIDLTDYTLYYIQNEKVYNLNGVSISDNILSNFERYNADTSEWTFDEKTQTLTRYNGDLTQKRGEQEVGEVIIPNYYNGKRVKNIGTYLFNGNTLISKVVIPKGIELIGAISFSRCTNLKGNLTIPDSVINIGHRAFEGCNSLDGKLILSKNLTITGTNAFKNCSNLKGSVIISDKLKVIESSLFSGCSSLDGEIIIGENVEEIRGSAFQNCTNLRGNLIIPDKVKKIGNWAFNNCKSLDGNIKLGNSLESIGAIVFSGCNMLKGDLIIPDSVIEIGHRAFEGCESLDGTLKLSENIESIGTLAFKNCSNLKGNIIISNKLEKVDSQVFSNCRAVNSIKFLNNSIEINSVPENAKIIGYSGSTAEAYAIKYNRTFEEIQ